MGINTLRMVTLMMVIDGCDDGADVVDDDDDGHGDVDD